MLAAGVGSRLGFSGTDWPAKVLLRFGGKSLLQYHIETLRGQGIEEIVLGVGYQHQDIKREIADLGAQDFVRTVFNKSYEEGNIVTLWTLRDELCCDEPVLLMDADVLYGEELIGRLLHSSHQNCFLLDRGFDPGDEPVKLCIRDGEIVEFRKWLSTEFDFCGESVGFFKLSVEAARNIVMQTDLYLCQGRRHEPYEEVIRDVVLTSSRGTFGFEDVTGTPWIEIDFVVDIERANAEVLPQILAAERNRLTVPTINRSIGQGGIQKL